MHFTENTSSSEQADEKNIYTIGVANKGVIDQLNNLTIDQTNNCTIDHNGNNGSIDVDEYLTIDEANSMLNQAINNSIGRINRWSIFPEDVSPDSETDKLVYLGMQDIDEWLKSRRV